MRLHMRILIFILLLCSSLNLFSAIYTEIPSSSPSYEDEEPDFSATCVIEESAARCVNEIEVVPVYDPEKQPITGLLAVLKRKGGEKRFGRISIYHISFIEHPEHFLLKVFGTKKRGSKYGKIMEIRKDSTSSIMLKYLNFITLLKAEAPSSTTGEITFPNPSLETSATRTLSIQNILKAFIEAEIENLISNFINLDSIKKVLEESSPLTTKEYVEKKKTELLTTSITAVNLHLTALEGLKSDLLLRSLGYKLSKLLSREENSKVIRSIEEIIKDLSENMRLIEELRDEIKSISLVQRGGLETPSAAPSTNSSQTNTTPKPALATQEKHLSQSSPGLAAPASRSPITAQLASPGLAAPLSKSPLTAQSSPGLAAPLSRSPLTAQSSPGLAAPVSKSPLTAQSSPGLAAPASRSPITAQSSPGLAASVSKSSSELVLPAVKSRVPRTWGITGVTSLHRRVGKQRHPKTDAPKHRQHRNRVAPLEQNIK